MICTELFSPPPVCRREILRYAGCREADGQVSRLLDACLAEAEAALTYRVCYTETELPRYEDLRACLAGSKKVILFAATVGAGFDRLLQKYSGLSPSRAMLLQAIGAERIESLCDTFCRDIAAREGLFPTRRFSPGYGSVPLEVQKEIFALLSPMTRIGLALTDSLLMTPTKSVTAWVGLMDRAPGPQNKCSLCQNTACRFRSAL